MKFFIYLSIMTCLLTGAEAVKELGYVEGKVENGNGSGVSDVNIYLDESGAKLGTTSWRGYFTLEFMLDKGELRYYQVTFRKDGYKELKTTVNAEAGTTKIYENPFLMPELED
ncbi:MULTISPECIES: carboxypeptidase-like regulatory domain-containing protein [Butyricimonas]|uniref:carboxypeptidase-like regulatory domain-containing protein n=1 Tax=Butyricimonas TaxID=574697 RepID=UPI0007FB3C24|nr:MULTISPECIES: carboxypeptidase-like regulatory domain-containing protein [Butyricimonas]